MCGIAGILRFDKQAVSSSQLKKMTDTIAHRGPDGEGQWVSECGAVGLGHRRLSILDLSEHGAQPMHYMHRYTLVFNGEIYNYIELKDQLRSKGYSFHNDTDSEVLIAAYDHYGTSCLSYFDGMFAFTLYDKLEKKIFCARDRFGEKPFLYYFDGNQFVFGSEMKAIWAHGINKKLNEQAVYNYLVTGRNEGNSKEDTFYDAIFKLKPSHYITFSLDKPEIIQTRYWNIDTTYKNIGVDDAIEQFDYLFKESVKRRLRSDVPVGSSLSGGLDSSMVVGYMADNKSIKQNTYSAKFPGFAKDESHYQELMVSQIKTNHHTTSPTIEENMAIFDSIVHHQEIPFGSISIAIQNEVFRLAKESGVTVLLDGQGADEILGGYSYFTFSLLKEKLNAGKLIDFVNTSFKAGDRQAKSAFYFMGGAISEMMPSALVDHFKSGDSQTAKNSLNPDFANRYTSTKANDIEIHPTLNQALKDSAYNYGLDQLLHYCDRNAMSHSVEVRLPFLYHELVEFIFSLPADLKIHQGWTKWIARKVAEKRIPKEIIWRKQKVAYESPDNFLYNHRNLKVISESYNNPDLDKYYKKGVELSDPKLYFRRLVLGKLLEKI